MTNFVISYARYATPRATEMSKFRTISGLPSRVYHTPFIPKEGLEAVLSG
jgi:hypothetical protein